MTFAFASNFPQAGAIAIPSNEPSVCRKRKGTDMEVEDVCEEPRPRPSRRMLAKLPRSNEIATFHALPPELNIKYLAAMGYRPGQQNGLFNADSATMVMDDSSSGGNNSPNSSTSDFFPSTPTDVQESESYFTQQYRQNFGKTKSCTSSANNSPGVYPNLDLYPHAVRAPGLMGMDMKPSENDMEIDGGSAGSSTVHGPQCRSIPQLHVRSEPGISSELWAKCPDCNQMSKIDAPPSNSTSLAYSP